MANAINVELVTLEEFLDHASCDDFNSPVTGVVSPRQRYVKIALSWIILFVLALTLFSL